MFAEEKSHASRRVIPVTAAVDGAEMERGAMAAGKNGCLVGRGSGGPALDLLTRPLTILVGHFGSGKTEIAVNLAFGFRNRGAEVTLVDLDLVKPYFRCRLVTDDLKSRGVRLVVPGGERFYADLPILAPEVRVAAGNGAVRKSRVIFDVGGNDLGARVLGSLSGVLDRRVTDLLFVVNVNRPFAQDLPSLRAMLDEIQTAARLPVTGLVANTHLMHETTQETVLAGIRAARELGAATGIPLCFCAMLKQLALTFAEPGRAAIDLPILAMERHILAPFALRPAGARRRSAVV
jgi:hypothetical protein